MDRTLLSLLLLLISAFSFGQSNSGEQLYENA